MLGKIRRKEREKCQFVTTGRLGVGWGRGFLFGSWFPAWDCGDISRSDPAEGFGWGFLLSRFGRGWFGRGRLGISLPGPFLKGRCLCGCWSVGEVAVCINSKSPRNGRVRRLKLLGCFSWLVQRLRKSFPLLVGHGKARGEAKEVEKVKR